MKFYISYFYQVRFFQPHMIPISTAKYDPKWFHNFAGHNHMFRDANGVINGIRLEMLSPSKNLGSHCINCSHVGFPGSNCEFLSGYYEQLTKLDFNYLRNTLISLSKGLGIANPIIVLLVHEAPDNPCSERSPLKRWFKENNIDLKEWERL